MRKRTIGMLVVAVLLAGLAARLVAVRLNAPVQVQAKKVVPQPSVLVATRNLSPGQFLRTGDLVWQAWPRASIAPAYAVKGHVHRQALAGRVLRVAIAAGEPVTKAATVGPGDHGFLAAVLKPGMRAITVPISATTGLAGLVSPGDHVDLILTQGVPGRDNRIMRHAGLTILRNIRVLALDQNLKPAAWKKPSTVSLPGSKNNNSVRPNRDKKTATLEVTPKQVEVVAVAQVMGGLSLSLRSLAQAKGASANVAELDSKVGALGPKLASLDPLGGHGGIIPVSLQTTVTPSMSSPVKLASTRVTYTLDSSVSPLLPPFPMPGSEPVHKSAPVRHYARENRHARVASSGVTILRGSASKLGGASK